ncbi:MAG: hypothetical protein KDB18_14415, partial [Salinibacterium sp.]|nr:hypothetical protein [Salinibacterium sp.]
VQGRPPEPILIRNPVEALVGRGAREFEAGDLEADAKTLLRARGLAPEDPKPRAWLAIVSMEQGFFRAAEDHVRDALRLDERCLLALEYQGFLLYRRERLEAALESWQKCLEIDPARQARLANVMTKVERELRVEATMRMVRSSHFRCKFSDEEDREIAKLLLDWLEEAWSSLGQIYRVYPRHPVTIILYRDREFSLATGAHSWVAGLFDGKIRVPVRNFAQRRREIRDTLFHEYTHFLITRLTKDCPVWLNEGLAQIGEGREIREVKAFLRNHAQAGTLVPLAQLSGSFADIGEGEAARLAYAESLSFCHYLEETLGIHRLVALLHALTPGTDPEVVFRQVLRRSLSQFEEAWVKQL